MHLSVNICSAQERLLTAVSRLSSCHIQLSFLDIVSNISLTIAYAFLDVTSSILFSGPGKQKYAQEHFYCNNDSNYFGNVIEYDYVYLAFFTNVIN